mgnify:CR=1 FL=1
MDGDGALTGRRRLYWRCRRGMLELDLLLQGFLEIGYPALGPDGRRAFERLLERPDRTLQAWLLGNETPDERELADVVAAIRGAAAD